MTQWLWKLERSCDMVQYVSLAGVAVRYTSLMEGTKVPSWKGKYSSAKGRYSTVVGDRKPASDGCDEAIRLHDSTLQLSVVLYFCSISCKKARYEGTFTDLLHFHCFFLQEIMSKSFHKGILLVLMSAVNRRYTSMTLYLYPCPD